MLIGYSFAKTVSLLYHKSIANTIVFINIDALSIVIDIYGYHFKITTYIITINKLSVDVVNIYG